MSLRRGAGGGLFWRRLVVVGPGVWLAACLLIAGCGGGARATVEVPDLAEPTLLLSQPDGASVAVVAAGPMQPYSAFNLHFTFQASPGLSKDDAGASADGSTIASPAPPLCALQPPPGMPADRVFACARIGGAATSTTGLLARLSFSASDGCISVRLVDFAGSEALGTYTWQEGPSPVKVDTRPRLLYFGSANPRNCTL
jgi:hypothetical protein